MSVSPSGGIRMRYSIVEGLYRVVPDNGHVDTVSQGCFVNGVSLKPVRLYSSKSQSPSLPTLHLPKYDDVLQVWPPGLSKITHFLIF